MKFQPSRVFVEYCSQFLLISSEIRTVGLGLKTVLIGVGIDTKNEICMVLERFIVSMDVAQCSQIYTFNPCSKFSITYSLSLEYNKKKTYT